MSRRREQVGKLIQREISSILGKEINDPRLARLISITEVSVSPDLRYAKVFISVLGDEQVKEETIKGFEAASAFLRCELGSRMKLRFVPDLSFLCDDSIERGMRLLKIIKQAGDVEE
jgi:ribosome-binding factor A